jgi:SAM-dependent methyltransferase
MKNGILEKAKPSIPNKIWSVGGITEHLGGVRATQQLLNLCPIPPSSAVVDLGCGTGFTACLLAQRNPLRILALDLNSSSIKSAQKRIRKRGYSDSIELIQADIHKIPIQNHQADVVIAESVLVFTQLNLALAEIRRVLKIEGSLADNEMILLKTPTPQLEDLLQKKMGIQTFSLEGWKKHYAQAGFDVIHSSVHHLNLRDQLFSHLQVDGITNYIKAVVMGLSDKTLWRSFINREIFQAFLDFRSFIGYGLFILKKR